jgi:hypothetical protein
MGGYIQTFTNGEVRFVSLDNEGTACKSIVIKPAIHKINSFYEILNNKLKESK